MSKVHLPARSKGLVVFESVTSISLAILAVIGNVFILVALRRNQRPSELHEYLHRCPGSNRSLECMHSRNIVCQHHGNWETGVQFACMSPKWLLGPLPGLCLHDNDDVDRG